MRKQQMSSIRALAIAAAFTAATLAAPAHSVQLPGLCDVVKNTACCQPQSLLDLILGLISLG